MAIAKEVADESITLVKNTGNVLPIRPETHKGKYDENVWCGKWDTKL